MKKSIAVIGLLLAITLVSLCACTPSANGTYEGSVSYPFGDKQELRYTIDVELKVLDAGLSGIYKGYQKAEIKIEEFLVNPNTDEKEKTAEVSIHGIWTDKGGTLSFLNYNRLAGGAPQMDLQGNLKPDDEVVELLLRKVGGKIYIDKLSHREIAEELTDVMCSE